MSEINHPNILHLVDFLESSSSYYLVIQYCNKGDVESYLNKQAKKFLSEKEALYFLKQIMNGFQVLRKHEVMHRDFKLANIFLNDDTIVIGDFGYAKAGFQMAQTNLGTPLTKAPELHQGAGSYNSKADLWSIGVVFYQLLYGTYPFYELSTPELLNNISKNSGNNLKFLDNLNPVSNDVKDLLRGLLQADPNNRLDWEHFFDHPVFGKSDNSNHKQEVLTSIVDTKDVDKEFEQNKEQAHYPDKTHIPLEPDDLPIQKKPQEIGDDTPSNQNDFIRPKTNSFSSSSNDLKTSFREYSFRYYHEKNKILMIFLTVKKLRQLMKEKELEECLKPIYLLIGLLAKKGTMLSELTLMSLKMCNNIFKQQHFDEFCKSQEYNEVVKQISEDQKNIFEYRDYILGLKKDLNLNETEQKLLTEISQGYVDFKFLDERSKAYYEQVRALDNVIRKSSNDQLRHFYLLTMIFAVYSIKSESYMPYMVDNHKFEWDTFREKHENIDSDALWKLLGEITQEF